jgi:hypothetical protein
LTSDAKKFFKDGLPEEHTVKRQGALVKPKRMQAPALLYSLTQSPLGRRAQNPLTIEAQDDDKQRHDSSLKLFSCNSFY